MNQLAVLAWRNIWRNRRRTLITASSIFFAVLLALIMRAMQLGSYDKMVRDIVEQYTGWIQIHANGYWNEKTINHTMKVDPVMLDTIAAIPGVHGVLRRLESFALASGRSRTRGVQVIGIDPKAENSLTRLTDRIDKGTYLEPDDRSALLAENLAVYLDLDVGDTVVLLGQGYHGSSAAGKYAVAGLLHFSSPELNNRMVYLPLTAAQELYATGNRVTSLVLNLSGQNELERITATVSGRIDTTAYEVMRWDDMLTEIVQQIASDNMAGIIMLGILYIIVGFGIFGTILMMTMERRREFSMVNAVGMTKRRIVAMVFLENGLLSFLGVLAGTIVAIPILYYFSLHPVQLTGEAAKMMESYGIAPVIPLLLSRGLLATHAVIVFGLTLVCSLYPLVNISTMKTVEGLRR